MLMVLTILQTLETSTFLNIVDHAGLMHQHLLCLIESRLQEKLLGLILILLHKFWFLALKMMDATVEKLSMPSNGWIKMTSLMKHAQFTEPEVMIMGRNVQLWQFAKTACQMSHASFQIHTIPTGLKNTDKFQGSKLWCRKSIKEDLLLAVLLYLML